MSRTQRPQLALAAGAGGLAGALSYTVQRLVDAAQEGPGYASVLAQAHIPYYWRCDLALLHACLAGLLVGTAVGEEAARRWLARSWIVPLVAVPCILALLAVP